ncbi:Fur family transcriptional regulator [Streptomyces sp. NPDC046977]|uniref:Fur family transcriptional regulator n=1 Tax=Streptomyces sp. NPDC046977 TaxID=3154703 RepID=UPI0034117460
MTAIRYDGEVVVLGGRRTPQRKWVLNALIDSNGFVSAQTLYTRLVQLGSPVGLSTVYRTLRVLTEGGRADIVRDSNGERLFRYRPSVEHQHYILCRRCGLSTAVEATAVEAWAKNVATFSGFAEVEHTVELSGLCPQCRVRG